MRTPTSPTLRLTAAALASAIALAACGTASGTTATGTDTPTGPSATSDTSAASAAPSTTVDANTASASDIVAALTANGVPNAARWANEVEEYRPYPTDDPDLTKLRQNIAKYNPSADTVTKIVTTLTVQP